MILIIGVRFRKSGKVYYFDPAGLPIEKGDHVIVETARGIEYGNVVLSPKEVTDDAVVQPLKPVIRIATPEDDAYSEENENFEVTLRVGGKKYAFEKTEVWISKIPEALETDGKAQRKRVFKNFEGDNRNEFRVK